MQTAFNRAATASFINAELKSIHNRDIGSPQMDAPWQKLFRNSIHDDSLWQHTFEVSGSGGHVGEQDGSLATPPWLRGCAGCMLRCSDRSLSCLQTHGLCSADSEIIRAAGLNIFVQTNKKDSDTPSSWCGISDPVGPCVGAAVCVVFPQHLQFHN